MIDEREKPVYAALDALGISYARVEHPAAMTMADCDEIDRDMDAQHCKNLFLCNRQETEFFLLLLAGEKKFRTAQVSAQIGKPRLSFSSPERLGEILGLTPGAVTPMGLINDSDRRVRVLIDRDVISCPRVVVHPNVNTASIVLETKELLRFIESFGYEITYVDIA